MSRNKTNTRIIKREFLYEDSSSGKPITVCKTTFECKIHDSLIEHLNYYDQLDKMFNKLTETGAELIEAANANDFTVYTLAITRRVACHDGDVYDEKLGRDIASTKCNIAIFRLMQLLNKCILECTCSKVITRVLNNQANNEIAWSEEKTHLDYLLSKIQSK